MNTAGSDSTICATETKQPLYSPTSGISDSALEFLIVDSTAVQPVRHATMNLTEELKSLSEILSATATADNRFDIGNI